jgi:hypothetical protein
MQQLESALEQYMGQAQNGSPIDIQIQPAGSQNSGGSQFLVTVSAPAAAASPNGTATAAPTAVTTAAPSTAAPASSAPAVAAPTAETLTELFGGSSNPAAVTPATPQAASSSTSSVAPKPASTAPSNMDPSDQVQVQMGGGGTATVPSLGWEIANQNKNMSSPLMSPDAILNEDQGELMDPSAQQTVPGTSQKWDDLTQDQQLAYAYGNDFGFPAGVSIQQYLNTYEGPSIMANAPANDPTMFGNS